MLNVKVKNLTLLSPPQKKKEKKAGILTTVVDHLVSRFGLMLTKSLFSIEWK